MTRVTRGLLAGWGAAAAVVGGVELIRANALGSVGPQWALTFLATYVVGLWVVTVQPANRAAVALLLFGCVALTWIAVSAELLVRVQAGARGAGFVLFNTATQALGYLFVAAEVEALIRYPHGRRVFAVEGWLVRGLVVVAALLPVALLVTCVEVVPAWVVQFSGESDGLAVPVVDSPWYVPAFARLSPAALVVDDWLLAFGPVVGAVVAIARYRRLAEADRRRLAWPLLAVIVLVLGTVLSGLADASALPRPLGEGVAIASQLMLPVAMGIGIAAPGLFDALGAARRTLSYLALSALVVGVYVAVAGGLGATVGGGDLYVAVIVAVVAALLLDPVRRTLVRRAERLAFGQQISRDELLLRLGETLERTLDRRALTGSIAETAMEGLGTEWVRLEVVDAETVHVGRARADDERPALSARLLYGHDDLGTITCGPPAGGRPRSRSRIQLERHDRALVRRGETADTRHRRRPRVRAGTRQRVQRAHRAARPDRRRGRHTRRAVGAGCGHDVDGRGAGGTMTTANPLRVVIADDHYLLREGLRALLEDSGQVEVCAAVGNAPELVKAVDRFLPDAVITDIRMPEATEGIEAAHTIRSAHPGIGIVVLSQHADGSYADALLAHGTDGLAYLLKERVGDLTELMRALEEVRAGRTALDSRIVDTLIGRHRALAPRGIDSLTPRERDVLREMARGLANTGIAQTLHLSESVVEKHIGSIFTKLGHDQQPHTHRRVAAVLAYLGTTSR
ncbi:MAG TPA: response regulator transcription factor [Nakamurella sp.]